MERSKLNAVVAEAEEVFARLGLALPPFAYWSAEELVSRARGTRIAEARLGWDVTDFGSGRFDETGLTLITLRNGSLAELQRGGGMCYAEKLLISRRDQMTPMHTHRIKAEDIISRGGAPLAVRLYASGPDGRLDEAAAGEVLCDGIARRFAPGEVIRLNPGESVTLRPGDWHAFWGEGGDAIVGEVSTVNDDETDNVFHEPLSRFSQVVEDEPPRRLLVSDYAAWLGAWTHNRS